MGVYSFLGIKKVEVKLNLAVVVFEKLPLLDTPSLFFCIILMEVVQIDRLLMMQGMAKLSCYGTISELTRLEKTKFTYI
jgi:hypothetical protein